MNYTYNVTGITCMGCVASIKKALIAVKGVEKVSVNFDTSELKIQSSKSISTEILQNALPEKYQINSREHRNVLNENRQNHAEEKSQFQQLFPLFLIFLFITAAAILLNLYPWDLKNAMLDFMGLFYVVFSFFKFLDLRGFTISFAMYDPLAKNLPFYGWVYPFVELTLGLFFLMRFQISLALFLTLIILGITTIGVTKSLLNKDSIKCACLGTALDLPMTKATFIENSIMIVMAVALLSKTLTS